MRARTDDFVGMLEGIGQAYDKGDVEGILKTPKTFVDGLKGLPRQHCRLRKALTGFKKS